MAADGSEPAVGAERLPTRERILRAARSIALERGYKGTTLVMIQKAAGVHAGSFYWHFKDKDALFAELVRYSYEQTEVSAERLQVKDAANPLRAMLASLVDNPERYGLWRFNLQFMLDRDMADTRTADEIRALRQATQRLLTDAWVGHIPEGVIAARPELPGQMADHALAVVEGCILARIAGTERDEDLITATATAALAAQVARACHETGEQVPEFFAAAARWIAADVAAWSAHLEPPPDPPALGE